MEQYNILVNLYKLLGSLEAKFNWAKCSLVGGREECSNLCYKIIKLRTRADAILHDLIDLSDQISFTELQIICDKEREKVETEIEKSFRPSDLVFNKKALVICTNIYIPMDIRIGLSFGYKFLFPYEFNQNNIFKLFAQLEMTIEQAIPELSILETSFEIKQILKNHIDQFNFNDTLAWLKFLSFRINNFFKNNPGLFATRTDKGSHTVIMSIDDYKVKLENHLSDIVYSKINVNPLRNLVSREKELLDELFILPFIKERFSKNIFQPHILTLAKFYGLPKIHKNGIPLRPITSTVNSPGFFLSKLFYQLLDIVFPRTDYHIKDSYDFVEFINNTEINNNDILVSFDVVSMYTSIPFKLVYDIIKERSNDFVNNFGINEDLLSSILTFLLKECSVFIALDKIYIQKDGLPMGNCLSPLIARIFMDKAMDFLLNQIQVSFIKVFVDDTIAALNINKVDQALEILNNFVPGKVIFTVEKENDHFSINFLNVTLIRLNNVIITNWYRKTFASGRLLNYFSSHKRATIIATAVHFIRTVLILSDACHFQSNRNIVIVTLHLNSFPEILIITLINQFYTYMKSFNQNSNNISDNQYVIFPHAINHSKRIKNTISKFKNPNITLADSIQNTKINFVKTVKSIDPPLSSSNIILSSTCKCKKRYIIDSTKFNETGKMTLKRLCSKKKRCDRNGHSFKYFKKEKGLHYRGQTGYLLRYIHWMYRHKLDSKCKYQFPTCIFKKLLKCACCKNK